MEEGGLASRAGPRSTTEMTETEREETRDYGAWRVPVHARLLGRQGRLQQGHRRVPPAPRQPPFWPPWRPQGKASVPRLLAFRMGLTLKEMIEKIFNQKT